MLEVSGRADSSNGKWFKTFIFFLQDTYNSHLTRLEDVFCFYLQIKKWLIRKKRERHSHISRL